MTDQHYEQCLHKSSFPLEVVAVYEDEATGIRAKYMIDRIANQLGMSVQVNLKMQHMDFLDDPQVRQLALIEAVAAHMIIFSFHAPKELPAAVRNLLDEWMMRKENRPYALSAMLDTAVAADRFDHPVAAELQRVATAAGADLFCRTCETTTDAADAYFQPIAEQATGAATRSEWAFSQMEQKGYPL